MATTTRDRHPNRHPGTRIRPRHNPQALSRMRVSHTTRLSRRACTVNEVVHSSGILRTPPIPPTHHGQQASPQEASGVESRAPRAPRGPEARGLVHYPFPRVLASPDHAAPRPRLRRGLHPPPTPSLIQFWRPGPRQAAVAPCGVFDICPLPRHPSRTVAGGDLAPGGWVVLDRLFRLHWSGGLCDLSHRGRTSDGGARVSKI